MRSTVVGALWTGLLLLAASPSHAKQAENEKEGRGINACQKTFIERQKLEATWTEEERKNSTAGKCWIACILEKRGMVRGGSVEEKRVLQYVRETAKSVNADFLRTRVDAERWGLLTRECTRHASSTDPCELGFNVWNCLLSNMKESTYRLPQGEDNQRRRLKTETKQTTKEMRRY